MERKNFDFKPVDYNNLNALSEMFSLCFNREPAENYFEWKFLQNPAGKAIGFVAYHETNIAGFYGVIPEHFMVNGEKTIIYQSMDTMTHPNYQRQGLFTRLAKKTYEHLINNDGEVFVIGFPGPLSHSGLIKVGWKDIVLIDYIFLNKTLFKVKKLLRKGPKLSFENMQRFDDSFDSYFADKNYPQGKIVKFIDEKSLNWRLSDNPLSKSEIVKISEGNQIVGFAVYKLDDNKRCFIHYLDFADDALYEKYLSAVCEYLFEASQSNFLFTFEPTQAVLAKAYKKNWFTKNRFSKGPFSYRPPFTGFSNREKIKGLNFFEKESYNLQPILRDY